MLCLSFHHHCTHCGKKSQNEWKTQNFSLVFHPLLSIFLTALKKKKKKFGFSLFLRLIRGYSLEAGLVWNERRMVGGGGEEERLVTEVSQGNVTSMTSAVISSILSLEPWNTIGSTWVPSTGGRGWPAMHDNYPCRNLLSLPSAAYPDKQ